jgi:hypothetical protein
MSHLKVGVLTKEWKIKAMIDGMETASSNNEANQVENKGKI